MPKSYSVMLDPVIPVTFLHGLSEEVGIRELLIRAHEISGLSCQSPLEDYALFRLLVAVSMDMLRPKRWLDRQSLLEEGRFKAETVDNYIADCEKAGPCFDLFDPIHPFMQTAYESEIDEKAIKPVANLSVTLPSGNNHVFWDHRPEIVPVMSPAEAFRSMITLYVFCTAAAQEYPSGVNNTPPVYNIILGDTLYDSIILNMVSSKEHPSLEDGFDLVPWRHFRAVIPKEECVNITMMEGLTWQPRRICLFRDEDGMVRKAALQQGKNFRGNDLWRDPHVSYRCSRKGEWNSVKPQAGRALWRDISTLLSDSESKRIIPPATVSRALDILDQDSSPLQIRQVGVVTEQASYIGWMEDRLSIPACLTSDDVLASLIRDDVEMVEYMQGMLAQSVNKHFSHDQKHSSVLAEEVRAAFLTQMHDDIFAFSIPDAVRISSQMDEERIAQHIRTFDKMVDQSIDEIFREIIQAAGNTAGDLQLQVETRREIRNKYTKYAKEREERYE